MNITKRMSAAIFFMLLSVSGCFAQTSSTAGLTPPGLTPGAPAGSYPLGDFDQVNLYNGNLNFALPLYAVSGRGGSGVPLVHRIESTWQVDEHHDVGYDIYEPNEFWWNQKVDYGPGLLAGRKVTFGTELPPEHYPCSSINDSLTTLTFTGPDGTEYLLRDTATDGEPQSSTWGCGSAPSRGTVFASPDGETMTFVSDSTIYDLFLPGGGQSGVEFYPSGVLVFKNGTRYEIDNGLVTKSTDRNGNQTILTYDTSGEIWKLTNIADSLGREVDIEYSVTDTAPFGLCDRIIFRGSEGDERIIRISKAVLGDALRSGSSYAVKTYQELFPDLPGNPKTASYNPYVTSAIWLPDGTLHYKFYYNPYGELARVELPMGGAFEYDFTSGTGVGMIVGDPDKYYIQRRLVEKRIYPDGGTGSTYSVKQTYTPATISTSYPGESSMTVDEKLPNGTLLTRSKHYFYGTNAVDFYPLGIHIPGWKIGREFKTEAFADDGTTVLRRSVSTWTQQSASWWTGSADYSPVNHPVVSETTDELPATQQISKIEYDYDSFNNVTDVYSYDYGTNSPGSLLRRQHTDYVTDTNYVSHTGAHLRGLPVESWVSSDAAGNDVESRTQFEYDNYTSESDPNHDPLVSRSSVTGHDSTNYGTGFIYRGNVTAVTSYGDADAETGAVTAYALYDILGNIVKTIDARGKETTIGYADNFGAADNDATTNSTPSQISGYSTFAFPTSTTNPLSWTAYVQYDYFTGKPVNTQDANGMKSKMLYDDPLDRPTQTVVALTTALESQTSIDYDDTNKQINVTSDLNALNDNLLKSVSLYDGLGRTKERRTYEAGGNYRAVQTEFDALGRAYKVSNPFRPGDTKYWSETTFDALGRPIQMETLDDGATVTAAYSGNRTIVTDPAGKQRISLTNAAGQLKDIWEIVPSSDGDTVSVTFPGGEYSGVAYGYKTSYSYDALNNLTHVEQGDQDRYFTYDSLSRLLSADNPESGEITYEYDANSNLIEKTDARGIVTTYTYDDLNRVTERAYAAPSPTPANYQATPTVTYTYDNLTNSKGRLMKVESSVSTTEYTEFDILGRVLKSKQTTDGVTYGNGTTDSPMTYTYNLAGGLFEQQYPSGRKVQNILDNDGQLEMAKSRKNANSGYWAYADNFTYNAAGAVTSVQLGNGTWESTAFNARLQPTQIALGTVQNGYDKLKLNYSYGDWVSGSIDATKNNGNIVQQIITVPTVGQTSGFTATQKYYYDSLNRIDDATEEISSSQTWRQDFTFDRFGNRNFHEANTTTLPKNCGTSPNFTVCTADKRIYNPSVNTSNNRIVLDQDADTVDDYAFDSSGNTTGDAQGRTFVYDAENKQVFVSDTNGTIGEYSYDGDGRRVKKIVPSTGEVTIFVYDAAGKLVAEYSTIVADTNDAKVAYLTNDHLGSPRVNTDKNGDVTTRHDYHPFGEEIATSHRTVDLNYADDTVRKQFTGYERDGETDLDFAQARMHNFNLGRFSSPDPLMASAKRILPQSWNRYTYVLNSPLTLTDPSGLDWGEQCKKGYSYCTYTWFRGKVPKGWKTVPLGTIVNPLGGGTPISLEANGAHPPAVPIDVPGRGRSWISQKDLVAINAISAGALCSLTASIVCPGSMDPEISGNVEAAANTIQIAFLIKSLVAAGVSLGMIAMAARKNVDEVAKLAEKELAKGCYKNGDCKVFADNLLKEMEKHGIKGEIRQLSSPTGEAIMKAGQETAGEAIAFRTFHHYGVQVGDNIYEMYKVGGVPISKWSSMYTTAGPGGSIIPTVLVSVPK